MTILRLALCLHVSLLAACTEAPRLPDRPVPTGERPVILPLDTLLAEVTPAVPPTTGADLSARAAALRARAAALP